MDRFFVFGTSRCLFTHPRKSHGENVIVNVPHATFIYSEFSPLHSILHLFSIHLFVPLVALYTCIVIYLGQVSVHFYHDIHDSHGLGVLYEKPCGSNSRISGPFWASNSYALNNISNEKTDFKNSQYYCRIVLSLLQFHQEEAEVMYV